MEEENAQLRTELASLREELAKAHDVMTALLAAQEQPASSAPEAIPTATLDDRFTCLSQHYFASDNRLH